MSPVIIEMVILLHVTFGCMFGFLHWQRPARFSRLMAQSWWLEAVRAYLNLTQLNRPGPGINPWHSLSDCLSVFATWWLVAACADLAGVRLPRRLGAWFVGLSLPLILALRYLAPLLLQAWFNLTPGQAGHWGVTAEQTVIFLPVTAARTTILYWFILIWRRQRLPGALLAIVFSVPYVVMALTNPVQFYFNYQPDWIYFSWAARVLGFSVGLVMLLFDKNLAAQREATRAYETVVETSHDLIWSVDGAGCWTFVNGAVRRIYGYEPAEVVGRPFADFEAEPAADGGRRIVGPGPAGAAHFTYDTEHRRKDGSRVALSFTVAVRRDQNGVVRGATGTAKDDSDRKRAEDRARHLAAFPELNPNPVLEFDAAGELVYRNPAALEMVQKLGFVRLEQLLPDTTVAIVRECLARGRPRRAVETKHGGNTLSWSFYPIASQQVVHCYVGDITERLLLEGQLRQSQKMDAVGQLAGGIAHDFNNLLTAIMGHLGLLHTNPAVTPEIADSLGEIADAAKRAGKLTSQLLSFSRLQVFSASDLDLNDVVTNLSKLLRRILGEHIVVELDQAPGRLGFHGDAGMMEQVLVNLGVNARDAMPEGGTLRIITRDEIRCRPAHQPGQEAAEPAPYVRLSVSDTGTGMTPEVRARIFEPFFTTKAVGRGTGLGLATVFGIVQQHQGWIEVESEPGRGTTFYIFLPRLAATPVAPSPLARSAAPGQGRGELVLLVEDEASVRDLGAVALRRFGYRVVVAADGPAALDRWREHRDEIALLLTDMVMPGGISGLQLADRLRGDRPALKVVYSSGYNAEIAGKDLALQEGLNFLAKPYELDRLFRTVRAALDHG